MESTLQHVQSVKYHSCFIEALVFGYYGLDDLREFPVNQGQINASWLQQESLVLTESLLYGAEKAHRYFSISIFAPQWIALYQRDPVIYMHMSRAFGAVAVNKKCFVSHANARDLKNSLGWPCIPLSSPSEIHIHIQPDQYCKMETTRILCNMKMTPHLVQMTLRLFSTALTTDNQGIGHLISVLLEVGLANLNRPFASLYT